MLQRDNGYLKNVHMGYNTAKIRPIIWTIIRIGAGGEIFRKINKSGHNTADAIVTGEMAEKITICCYDKRWNGLFIAILNVV